MNCGDIVEVDFGHPIGSEAAFKRPAVVLTSDGFLRYRPTTIFVVPLTTSVRSFPSHIEIPPDATNGLDNVSCALVEQMRAVSTQRCANTRGNVGPTVTHQLLDILALITGMP